jgi:hypothetical protein
LHQEKRRQSNRSVATSNNNDANKLEEVKEFLASSGNLEVIRFTPEGRQRTTTIGILLKQYEYEVAYWTINYIDYLQSAIGNGRTNY